MNFFEAMVALQMGAKVRSILGETFEMDEGVVLSYGDDLADDDGDGYTLTEHEINGRWTVVEPTYGFAWAIEALLSGANVRRSSWPLGVHLKTSDIDGRLLFNQQPQRPLSPQMMQEWLEADDWVLA